MGAYGGTPWSAPSSGACSMPLPAFYPAMPSGYPAPGQPIAASTVRARHFDYIMSQDIL